MKELKLISLGELRRTLKKILREYGIKQEDLYNRTGYYFEDVKSLDEVKDIERILDI